MSLSALRDEMERSRCEECQCSGFEHFAGCSLRDCDRCIICGEPVAACQCDDEIAAAAQAWEPEVPTALPEPLSHFTLIQSLDAAIRLIGQARVELAAGSMTLWRIVNHAEQHLERQIAGLLGE